MAVTAAAAAAASTLAAAAYLDAKYHIRSDLSSGGLDNAASKAQKYITQRASEDRLLQYHNIEYWARKNLPNHLFLEYANRSWTYAQFYSDLQRVGNWLMKDLGIEKKEMVALSGPNSAEYMLLWFGLEGVGVPTSFINHNMTGEGLVHSIKLCDPRFVLADVETRGRMEPVRGQLEAAGIKIIYYDEELFTRFTDSTPIPRERNAGISPMDTRSLIYTSGTTGLPKGVILIAGRLINTARSMAEYLKLKQTDKFFTCLPLYHGAAQGLCVTPVIHTGASMRLGKKFSHRTFWPEVSESGATHLQYVGELCRYLINSPVHPLERKHLVKMAWGNGMRPDVWEKFRQRFNIPIINELYAATDGLGASFNANHGEFGRNCIGIRGAIWKWKMGEKEIHARIDPDTEDIVRNADGWVERSDVNEPGEVIHKLDPAMLAQTFKGYYRNEAATQKRLMRDVFERGDLWFRSGDVHRQDADGRLYFVDRLGDTFRWKSENVSTNEVADALGLYDQIAEASVYGVSVPHADGRCGCATIVLKEGVTPETLDTHALGKFVLERLPRYAVPLFLRIATELSYTGTFKIQKGQAKREGVDVDVIEKSGSKDRLFWLPPGGRAYVGYGREEWENLRSGRVKL